MASYIPDLTQTNISMWTLPVFWIITLSPRSWSRKEFHAKTGKSFDARSPRDFPGEINASQQLDAATKGKLTRAEAAVAHGIENFGLYAAALTAGNAAKLDPLLLNGLSLAFLASRVVFNYVYINNETEGMAAVRSVTYVGGLGMLFTLFIKAGNKLYSQ